MKNMATQRGHHDCSVILHRWNRRGEGFTLYKESHDEGRLDILFIINTFKRRESLFLYQTMMFSYKLMSQQVIIETILTECYK